jgi:hypothetical protein
LLAFLLACSGGSLDYFLSFLTGRFPFGAVDSHRRINIDGFGFSSV